MTLKVKIIDTYVENRTGKSKSGKDYSLNTQINCFLEINGEVRKFPQVLQSGQQPYAPGLYEFNADEMLTLNAYNSLVITPFSQPVLHLIK